MALCGCGSHNHYVDQRANHARSPAMPYIKKIKTLYLDRYNHCALCL
jgi:hypothetical protein